MKRTIRWAAGALLVWAMPLLAEQIINVDELPRKVIVLPTGERVAVIEYLGSNWRVEQPTVLERTDVPPDPDVCFEAKFDSFQPPDKIKPFGFKGGMVVVSDDGLRKRAVVEFKRNDNLWFCGKLRRAAGGKGLDLGAVAVLKQLPDIDRYGQAIERGKKEGDGNKLLDLGHQIDTQGKQDIRGGLGDFEKLEALRDRAYDEGLKLLEAKIDRQDPKQTDEMFGLAAKWRELRKSNRKFREWVELALKLNPEHPKAAEVAEREWGWEKFQGKWRPKHEIEEILEREKKNAADMAAANKAAKDRKERDRKQAVLNRPVLLLKHQAALRGDAAGRERAVKELGEAAQKSLDSDFGAAAVEILANLEGGSSVAALEAAGKSDYKDVRQQALEALAWRGGRNSDGAGALTAMAGMLQAEKDVETVRAGADAVAALGPKEAAGVLIASLTTDTTAAQEEIVERLKTVTRQPFKQKKEWDDWWSKNKDGFK